MNDIVDAPARPAPRISFVSLGCPKALVDSERILTQLRAEGYELSRQHAGADAVIVNTCGFLDSAKKESLEAIGAAMAAWAPSPTRFATPSRMSVRSPARRPMKA
jgi:ribosomal protein S12 methylthiotransferase